MGEAYLPFGTSHISHVASAAMYLSKSEHFSLLILHSQIHTEHQRQVCTPSCPGVQEILEVEQLMAEEDAGLELTEENVERSLDEIRSVVLCFDHVN